MAVIVVASNKGGVGKTTITILLAEELARRGFKTGVVEADAEHHISNYLATRENNELPCNFTLTSDEDATTLGKTIRAAEEGMDFVIVDLPGFGGLSFTRAVARANLVLIPMKPGAMDSNSATNAIEQIMIEEDHIGRPIKHRIIMNMVKDAGAKESAVALDHSEREMRKNLIEGNYQRLDSELSLRRGPFVSFYTYAQTLPEMLENQGTQSLEKAWREVRSMANEVLNVMEVAYVDNEPDNPFKISTLRSRLKA